MVALNQGHPSLGNEATALLKMVYYPFSWYRFLPREKDHEYHCVGVTYAGRKVYAYNEMVWWFWMCQLSLSAPLPWRHERGHFCILTDGVAHPPVYKRCLWSYTGLLRASTEKVLSPSVRV